MHEELSAEEFKRLFLELNHDLRSPVVSFYSFLKILEFQDYVISPEDLKDYAEDLQIGAARFFELFDRLMLAAGKNVNRET